MQQPRYSIPAVVLGMSICGLGVCRSLGRHGVPVIALDHARSPDTFRTRFARCSICPHPVSQADELVSTLQHLAQSQAHPPVLLPTTDNFTEFLHKYRETLKHHFVFILPETELMESLISKHGQYTIARQHDMESPLTLRITTADELNSALTAIRFPVVIKGETTHGWRMIFHDTKVLELATREELLRVYTDKIAKNNISIILQELVPSHEGEHFEFCAYINAASRTEQYFVYRKIRQYPFKFGFGASITSINAPDLVEKSMTFLRKIGYRGLVNIEYMLDQNSHCHQLIEMNLRFWAQNELATCCGLNFPLLVYHDLVGLAPLYPSHHGSAEGIKWISFGADRAAFHALKQRGELTWTQWLASVIRGKRMWAYWAWDDPLPFLGNVHFGYTVLQAVANKLFR